VRHGLSTFVETGTFKGDGLHTALLAEFRELHSVEIDPELYHSSAKVFASVPNVFVHLGESHVVLPHILEYALTDEPTLFWLDAYYPYADSGKHSYRHESNDLTRMPILSELSAIISYHSNVKDLVIIDDLRCFTDDERIPALSFDRHMESLGARGQGCTRQSVVGVELSDILRLTSGNFAHELVFQYKGYIVLLKTSASIL